MTKERKDEATRKEKREGKRKRMKSGESKRSTTTFCLFARSPLSTPSITTKPLVSSLSLSFSLSLFLVTNLQVLPFYVSFFGFPTLRPPICGSGDGDARSFSLLLRFKLGALAAASSRAWTLASSLSRALCCSGRIHAK